VSFRQRRQFADVVPFDRMEIRVIIEYDLWFAILENRVYYVASASESVSTRVSAMMNSPVASWKPALTLFI
jgi:hypothetical protein